MSENVYALMGIPVFIFLGIAIYNISEAIYWKWFVWRNRR